MSEKIKISELFGTLPHYLEPYARECEYPWEIIGRIGEIIADLSGGELRDFTLLRDGVLVGEGVRIAESARIEPPAVIGANTEIRHGAYLRGNVIVGENCVIGNSSEIKNSILLEGVQVPHYNYVGDSILGNKAHLGAGAICSNLKSGGTNVSVHTSERDYDTKMRKLGAMLGDGADIGCGCVLAPGCIVGKNTTVYPLTFLRGTIPKNSIVKSMSEIVEKRI